MAPYFCRCREKLGGVFLQLGNGIMLRNPFAARPRTGFTTSGNSRPRARSISVLKSSTVKLWGSDSA